MIIDYKLILYTYYPVLILVLIAGLRDRFEPQNKVLKAHNWTLIPAIFLMIFFHSGSVVIQSFWYYIPIFKNYEYNQFNLDIVIFGEDLLILILAYLFLRYIYHVSIADAFYLKLSQFPFILKVCAVLTIINICIYFLDLNSLPNIQGTDYEFLRSMNMKNFVIYYFGVVIIAPIVEESIFRGLIFSPLYRKCGRYIALVLSSLFWTYGHPNPLLSSIGIFIFGLILGWLYDRSGSLIHPIVLHMFQNSWIVVYYLT